MIALGLRLRDCPSPGFDWRDLSIIVRYSRPTSHLFRVMFPERAGWDLHAMLTGKAVDYLALNLWAKTKAGRRGYNRPKSILPVDKPRALPGSKPKAAPLSKIKERMARLHAPRGPRHLDTKTDAEKLRDLFRD